MDVNEAKQTVTDTKDWAWGAPPSDMEPDDVNRHNQMTTLQLYLLYDQTAIVCEFARHEAEWQYNCRYLPKRDYKRIKADAKILEPYLAYLIYTICKREGMEVSEPEAGEQLNFDQEALNKWHQFYYHYYELVLTTDQRNEFQKRANVGEDVSTYAPSGDWRI